MDRDIMDRCFSPGQISHAAGSFFHAEKLVSRYFRMTPDAIRSWRYDVKTLADLESHEINDNVFAHLCKYRYRKDGTDAEDGFDFYRICLQDNRILDAVERAGSFIRLSPLLLYIAAHELVHVVRFNGGEVDFDMEEDRKEAEEENVNGITQEILRPVDHPRLDLVLECFSKRYQLDALYQ